MGTQWTQFILLLFQLPWWALDGQALAGSNRQPVSHGHMPVWNWADEGNKSKPHEPFSQIRHSPQRTGPQTALMNSLNECAHAGTLKKLSERADKLTGGWILLDSLPKTKA